MYSLSIIGGGMISCGYDSPSSKEILTHLHASLVHKQIKLDAVVEIDINQKKKIKEKWGEEIEIFSNLETLFKNYKSDILVVATPTSTHLQVIKDIFTNYEPKLILCEKPVVQNIMEFIELKSLESTKSTKLLTNYIRRFDPSLNELVRIIKNSTSRINHFYGTFTKDFLHNGSHMIDLIHMLIGQIDYIQVLNQEIIDNELFGQFLIKTEKANGVISNINDSSLSLFELTIYTDKAKVEIIGANQDIRIHYINESTEFNGYKSFLIEKKLQKTLDKYGYNTLEFLIKIIENDEIYSNIKIEQDIINEFLLQTQQKIIG